MFPCFPPSLDLPPSLPHSPLVAPVGSASILTVISCCFPALQPTIRYSAETMLPISLPHRDWLMQFVARQVILSDRVCIKCDKD